MASSFLRACLLAVMLGLGPGASAEDGGGSSVPDGSVGEGGADRDNPEGEDSTGRVTVNCRSTSDCSPGFSCTAGRCRYSGLREAERVGCLLGPEAAIGVLALGILAARRRSGP